MSVMKRRGILVMSAALMLSIMSCLFPACKGVAAQKRESSEMHADSNIRDTTSGDTLETAARDFPSDSGRNESERSAHFDVQEGTLQERHWSETANRAPRGMSAAGEFQRAAGQTNFHESGPNGGSVLSVDVFGQQEVQCEGEGCKNGGTGGRQAGEGAVPRAGGASADSSREVSSATHEEVEDARGDMRKSADISTDDLLKVGSSGNVAKGKHTERDEGKIADRGRIDSSNATSAGPSVEGKDTTTSAVGTNRVGGADGGGESVPASASASDSDGLRTESGFANMRQGVGAESSAGGSSELPVRMPRNEKVVRNAAIEKDGVHAGSSVEASYVPSDKELHEAKGARNAASDKEGALADGSTEALTGSSASPLLQGADAIKTATLKVIGDAVTEGEGVPLQSIGESPVSTPPESNPERSKDGYDAEVPREAPEADAAHKSERSPSQLIDGQQCPGKIMCTTHVVESTADPEDTKRESFAHVASVRLMMVTFNVGGADSIALREGFGDALRREAESERADLVVLGLQESALRETDAGEIFAWGGLWGAPHVLGTVPSLGEDPSVQMLLLLRVGAQVEGVGTLSKVGCFFGGVHGVTSGMTGMLVRVRSGSRHHVLITNSKLPPKLAVGPRARYAQTCLNGCVKAVGTRSIREADDDAVNIIMRRWGREELPACVLPRWLPRALCQTTFGNVWRGVRMMFKRQTVRAVRGEPSVTGQPLECSEYQRGLASGACVQVRVSAVVMAGDFGELAVEEGNPPQGGGGGSHPEEQEGHRQDAGVDRGTAEGSESGGGLGGMAGGEGGKSRDDVKDGEEGRRGKLGGGLLKSFALANVTSFFGWAPGDSLQEGVRGGPEFVPTCILGRGRDPKCAHKYANDLKQSGCDGSAREPGSGRFGSSDVNPPKADFPPGNELVEEGRCLGPLWHCVLHGGVWRVALSIFGVLTTGPHFLGFGVPLMYPVHPSGGMSYAHWADKTRRLEQKQAKQAAKDGGSINQSTHAGVDAATKTFRANSWKKRELAKSEGCCFLDHVSRGWCDRIVHGSDTSSSVHVRCLSYKRFDVGGSRWSEHAPVYGIYDLREGEEES